MNSEFDFNEIYSCYNLEDNLDLELPLSKYNSNNIFKQNYIDIETSSIYSNDDTRRLSYFFNDKRNNNSMIFPTYIETKPKSKKKKNIFLEKLKKLMKF